MRYPSTPPALHHRHKRAVGLSIIIIIDNYYYTLSTRQEPPTHSYSVHPSTAFPPPNGLFLEACGIHTPLRVEAWRSMLKDHPDRPKVEYVLTGMSIGFEIGFNHHTHQCTPLRRKMHSTRDHPQVVSAYLANELHLGRIHDPCRQPPGTTNLHTSPIGVIPKKHKPGQWRLICDLSAPKGNSVNDGIEPDSCSMRYTSTADAIGRLGRHTLLAKIDVKEPIGSFHTPLRQGVAWATLAREHLRRRSLPFGLRSAPKMFDALADMLNWHRSMPSVYSPLLGRLPHNRATQLMHSTVSLLCLGRAALGVPLAVEKAEGPTITCTNTPHCKFLD